MKFSVIVIVYNNGKIFLYDFKISIKTAYIK